MDDTLVTHKNPMVEIEKRPVISIQKAVDKIFEGAMELLEGTRRLMEEAPATTHKRWNHSEPLRPEGNQWTDETWAAYRLKADEADVLFPATVIDSGGDDTWFDYIPCDLNTAVSLIKLALRVIGTDDFAGPPKQEEVDPLIKPLLTEWLLNDCEINDPASDTGYVIPSVVRLLHKYEVPLTLATDSLHPNQWDEDSDKELFEITGIDPATVTE